MLSNTNNYATITADTLNDSGFYSVVVVGKTIAFSGNVSINVPGSLTLAGHLTLVPIGNFTSSYTAPSIGATVVDGSR